MKRVLFLIVVIVLLSGILSASGTKFTFTIYGNYLTIEDDDFKRLYGGKKYYPEGKISVAIFGNLYLWGSYGFFPSRYNWTEWSNKGLVLPDIEGERTADKRIMSGGVGFFAGYIRPSDFSLKIVVGICNITNAIESMRNFIDTNEFIDSFEEKQSATGIRGRLGVTYGLYKKLFSELSVSYMYAADKVNDSRVNLGGLQVSVGLGLTF